MVMAGTNLTLIKNKQTNVRPIAKTKPDGSITDENTEISSRSY